MRDRVERDRAAVQELAGGRSPQVSSKCPGLDVDIAPDWTPDGRVETEDVSAAQILALHIALEQRYGALTTTASDLGSTSSPRACAGRPLWVSIVPERFEASEDALTWCDRQRIPVDECGARHVVPRGRSGTELKLRKS
jgi:hypothetical protein